MKLWMNNFIHFSIYQIGIVRNNFKIVVQSVGGSYIGRMITYGIIATFNYIITVLAIMADMFYMKKEICWLYLWWSCNCRDPLPFVVNVVRESYSWGFRPVKMSFVSDLLVPQKVRNRVSAPFNGSFWYLYFIIASVIVRHYQHVSRN